MIHNYLIETYGCQMNVAESNAIELLLKGRGMEPVTDAIAADVVIINTCSVRKQKTEYGVGLVSIVLSRRNEGRY